VGTIIGRPRACATRLLVAFLPVVFALSARWAAASCENTIEVRGPGFEYAYNDIEPYAENPIGVDSLSDARYAASVAQLYERLARALAVASHIHSTFQDDGAGTGQAPRGDVLVLWEAPQYELRRYMPGDRVSAAAPPDTLVDRLRRGASDNTAVLYAVQIGSFVEKRHAFQRRDALSSLVPRSHAPWDTTRIVEWRNSACGDGDRRAELFILGPDEGPGAGYKVMHGLFIDRRDALAARADVRTRFGFPAAVIPVRATGRVLRSALRPLSRSER